MKSGEKVGNLRFIKPTDLGTDRKNLIGHHLGPRSGKMSKLERHLKTAPSRRTAWAEVLLGPGTGWVAEKAEFLKFLSDQNLAQVGQMLVVYPDKRPTADVLSACLTSPYYFIKPLRLHGAGLGVQYVAAAQVSEAIQNYNQPALIHEDLEIDREFRWWWYHDLEDNDWRILYEKITPRVVGTGTDALHSLILQLKRIPLLHRARLLVRNRTALFTVPEYGEKVAFSHSIGSRRHGAIEQLISDREQDIVDTIDYQAWKLAQQLAILGNFPSGICHAVFDLGYYENTQQIVPIEFQFPYSLYWWLYANHLPWVAIQLEVAIQNMILKEHC